MSLQELRIAKLSRALNNSILNKTLQSSLHTETHAQVLEELLKDLETERKKNRDIITNLKQQNYAEERLKQQEKQLNQLHLTLLQKQIPKAKQTTPERHITSEFPFEEPKPNKTILQQSFKAALDAQLAEKQRIQQETLARELAADKQRIAEAQASLEEEQKTTQILKNSKKQDLLESWEALAQLKALQQATDKTRWFHNSSPFAPIPEEEEDPPSKRSRVLKRYQKTFGKAKLVTQLQTPINIVRKTPPKPKQKTPRTHRSSASYLQTQIHQLEQEESKIKEEKAKLSQLLQEKSRSASRQTTVGSMVSQLKKTNLHIRRTSMGQLNSSIEAVPRAQDLLDYRRPTHRPMSFDEVGDLMRTTE